MQNRFLLCESTTQLLCASVVVNLFRLRGYVTHRHLIPGCPKRKDIPV